MAKVWWQEKPKRLALVSITAAVAVVGVVILVGAKAGLTPKPQTLSLTGRLVQIHADDFIHSRSSDSFYLYTGTQKIKLQLAPEVRFKLRPESVVKLTGIVSGNSMSVSSAAGAQTVQQAAYSTLGPQPTAVVLVNFTNGAKTSTTKTSAMSTLTSTSQFFSSVSFGKTSLVGKNSADFSGDVYGPVTVNGGDTTKCNDGDWTSQAYQSLTSQGIDLSGYQHILFSDPGVSACDYGGVAQVGSWWSAYNGGLCCTTHELGHNYGLEHANAYRCHDVNGNVVVWSAECNPIDHPPGKCQLGIGCTLDTVDIEYGDPFSVMDHGSTQYNAYEKAQLGWIDSSHRKTILTDGDYTLLPSDVLASGSMSLRIPRKPYNDQNEGVYGSEEFVYLNFNTGDSGVQLHLARNYAAAQYKFLLDNTPTTSSFSDARLLAGQTFTDPLHSDLTIKVVSVSASAVVVHITVAKSTPTAPTNLRTQSYNVEPTTGLESNLSTHGNEFSWIAASDSVTGIYAYDIYRDGTFIGSTHDSRYADYDKALLPNTSYKYTIKARNYFNVSSVFSTGLTMKSPAALIHDYSGVITNQKSALSLADQATITTLQHDANFRNLPIITEQPFWTGDGQLTLDLPFTGTGGQVTARLYAGGTGDQSLPTVTFSPWSSQPFSEKTSASPLHLSIPVTAGNKLIQLTIQGDQTAAYTLTIDKPVFLGPPNFDD